MGVSTGCPGCPMDAIVSPCCLATIKAGMQESTLPWLPSSRSIHGWPVGEGPVGLGAHLVVEVEV